MKKLINKSVAIFFFVISSNMTLFAQANVDSLRIVNEALQMIKFPDPTFKGSFVPNITPKAMEDMGFEQPHLSETIKFKMSDGVEIHGEKFQHSSNKTVLLLHGTLASSYTYNKMAGLLREALQAEVIAVDLRGHGQSGGVPGDIATLNQYAEDLDDLIVSITKEKSNQTIILAGHSMGGGIILRHTETFPKTNKIGGYLLFAPNLGNNSPTTHQNLELNSNFIKMHLSRGLGLSLLNEFGIHKYDSLHVVFYNLPKQMPIRSYSYRSMQASFPKDYRKAFQSINKPLLVLVGSDDEAFIANEYTTVIRSYSKGKSYIIEGETHNGIRHNEETMRKVRNWSIDNNLR